MTPVRLLRITLPLALIALVLCLIFNRSLVAPPLTGGPTVTVPQAVLANHDVNRAAAISPPPVTIATVASSSTEAPSEPPFQPGHFPGVSTRHVPGPDPRAANDPPPGVPHEVTLRSGEKLIRTLTDERDAIPLMPSRAR